VVFGGRNGTIRSGRVGQREASRAGGVYRQKKTWSVVNACHCLDNSDKRGMTRTEQGHGEEEVDRLGGQTWRCRATTIVTDALSRSVGRRVWVEGRQQLVLKAWTRDRGRNTQLFPIKQQTVDRAELETS
jgi:hypothetical protein